MRAFLAVSACHNLALIDTYTKKLFLREQAEHVGSPSPAVCLDISSENWIAASNIFFERRTGEQTRRLRFVLRRGKHMCSESIFDE